MRLFLFALLSLALVSASAQSKKELQAQNDKLKAEIEELKKPKPPKEIPIVTSSDSTCYGIGVLLGTSVKKQIGDTINLEVLLSGMKDVFQGATVKMDEKTATMRIQQSMSAAMERRTRKLKEESKTFLEENKTKPGVMTTASGLQYKVLVSGKGKMPTAKSSVTVHYTGKLVDGTVFDSSVERNEPATFSLDSVIPGWTEALQLMHEGDKWMVFVPSELGYGERGAGGQIPPYAALIFEIELIKVN